MVHEKLTEERGLSVNQRRGVLAALAAVVTGVFARSAKPAEAATGSNFVLGQNNNASNLTRLDVFGDQALLVGTDTGNALSGATSATSAFGVSGSAPNGYGVTGITHKASYASLLGFADTAGSSALQGTATAPNVTAGAFFGPVSMFGDVNINAFSGGAGTFSGNLTVAGNLSVSGTKSAAVRSSDGANHLLFCVESTESWFEDFGEATLENGFAQVALDPLFADVTHIQTYHVFLTPYAETQGLYVTTRTSTGFIVREIGNGKSTAPFSYRVVAKRKDVPAARLPKVDLHKPQFAPAHLELTGITRTGGPHRP
jgi:hypothetical protein